MPYTPPSHRSPSSSATSSPEVSRRSSFNGSKPASSTTSHVSPKPTLPRSSSYLTRHRRTPSAVSPGQPTPQATSEDLQGMVRFSQGHDDTINNKSVRQSPPPVTGDRRGMPTGAVISPPDSPPSSDDEDARGKARGRQIENMNELKQLHEAISQLPQQRRESSPSETPDIGVLVLQPSEAGGEDGMRHSFSTSSLDQFSRIAGRSGSSPSGRRVSHVRSATEPSVSASPSAGSSLTGSDEENDLEIMQKPQMVRKKSGELVRPALRLGSRRRPSSMPGTPTFSKAVHFDSHLEHVRHFLQVDRPTAVSAGSSPVEVYDSEGEYPFNGNGDRQSQKHSTPPFEWEIILTKFPVETPARRALPVRLERVWLSADQKFLHGSVAVLNLAFSKSVVCRFTLDYWKTTSEIAAEYSAEILPRTAPEGHDRFNFTIKLSDLANLESKTLYFCIRYNVDGKEFWDNNNGANFQVDFKKKMLPINGKNGFHNGGSLPRSTRRQNPSTAPRPLSMPVSLDDFDDSSKVMFDQSIHEYLGESVPTLRLKSSQSAMNLPSDNLASRLTSPSGQAFANRYDFGASLSAAVQAAKDAMTNNKRDGLYMRSGRKFSVVPVSSAKAAVNAAASSANSKSPVIAVNTTHEPATVALPIAALDRDTRAILAESDARNGPGSIASKSYDEIVSKYCFYVPKQPGQTKDGTSEQGQSDGSAAEQIAQFQSSPASTVSSDGSPAQSGFFQQPASQLWQAALSRDSSSSTVPSYGSAPSPPVITIQRPDQQLGRSPLSAAGSLSSGSTRSASPASPASMVGAFSPFASTPSSDYPYQHMKDRFPFNNADAHSATTIRG